MFLRYETLHANSAGLRYKALRCMHCEEEDRNARQETSKFFRRAESIQHRHIDVEDYHVWSDCNGQRHGFFSVLRFVNDNVFEGIGENRSHAISDGVVVISEDYPHAFNEEGSSVVMRFPQSSSIWNTDVTRRNVITRLLVFTKPKRRKFLIVQS
jgi:hypothetical protein